MEYVIIVVLLIILFLVTLRKEEKQTVMSYNPTTIANYFIKNHKSKDMTPMKVIKLFEDRKKTFVLAFTSQLASDAIVEENLDLYASNIAKFSLIECSSEMRIKYYDMEIIQILRT